MTGEQGERSRDLLWTLSLTAAIGIGVLARLEDPLSTWVIPAEDPYTHMALVRDHLADGSLDPLHEGGRLYPPGMHAFVAAAWAFTGADLYNLFRFTPVLFGAIGILALALLLLRFEGKTAAVLGAFAIALAPEAVVRTTMMAPTAMDLFLIPVFLYALLHVAQGRMTWLGVAAPVALFLVFSHPWVFGIMSMTGLAFLVLALALPWSKDQAPQVSAQGLAAGAAVIAAGVAMSMDGCWGTCGPGFKVVLTARLVALAARRLPELAPDELARQAASMSLIPVVLVGLSLGGVWAATPDAGDHRWYRLFEACEMETLGTVAQDASQDPEAIVVTGDWRPKLVIAALAGNASRVWFTASFYTASDQRQDMLGHLDGREAPYHVLVDQHTRQNTDANLSFLDDPGWEQTHASGCTRDDGTPRVAVYRHSPQ